MIQLMEAMLGESEKTSEPEKVERLLPEVEKVEVADKRKLLYAESR